MTRKQWLKKYYGQLEGGNITNVTLKEEYGEVWVAFNVKTEAGLFCIEVSRDEEGNGPGFLFGLPNVK